MTYATPALTIDRQAQWPTVCPFAISYLGAPDQLGRLHPMASEGHLGAGQVARWPSPSEGREA